MNRRRFLGVTVTTATAFSGCTGSETQNGVSGQATTSVDRPNPAAAEEHIFVAKEQLRQAVSTYSEEVSYVVSWNSGFASDPVTISLEKADTELKSAKEQASDDQLVVVSALQDYSTLLRGMVSATESVVESLNQYSTAISYHQTERFGDAAMKMEEADIELDKIQGELKKVRTKYKQLPSDILGGTDVAYEQFGARLTEFEGYVTGLNTLYEGGVFQQNGLSNFYEGTDQFRSGQYSDAVECLEEAYRQFTDGKKRYKQGEETAPNHMMNTVIQHTCQVEVHQEITHEFLLGAQLAEDGDMRSALAQIEGANEIRNHCS